MTTATINFDQPTLFRERRFSRDDVAPPRRDRDAPATPPRMQPTGRTLDDVLSAAWDGLAAHHAVTCPVCTGSMAPRYGSGAKPVGGRCGRCGSTLG